jgi:hypothetical protein
MRPDTVKDTSLFDKIIEETPLEIKRFVEKSLLLNEILTVLPELNYEVTKNNGQYIEAISVHKWDTVTDKLVSANGKRKIYINIDTDYIFFGIREDADTRYAFNGFIETIEDIKKIDHLTKIM